MKKLLLVLFMLFPFTACEKDEEEVDEPMVRAGVEMQEDMAQGGEPEEDADMGLEGGEDVVEEDMAAGDQDASGGIEEEGGEPIEDPVLPEAGEMVPEEDCGERPEEEQRCGEEEPEDEG